MVAKAATASKETEINIVQLKYTEMRACLLGESPLIMHRFSDKSRRELLMPALKQNRAGLESVLKHQPQSEYQGCFYVNRDKKTPTLFHLPNNTLHQAIAAAAIDLPGSTKKAQILRMISIRNPTLFLYGIPKLYMAMVRSSGIQRSPDVRTRPAFREWAAAVNIRYPVGILTQRSITALLAASGQLCGIGDRRTQKGGGGDWGCFRIVPPDDPDFVRITKDQGRKAQMEAYENPEPFDDETSELYIWFKEECLRREKNPEVPGLPFMGMADGEDSDFAPME